MVQSAAFAGTRPLLPEERGYLEGALRAEAALPRALVPFLATLGAEVLLLTALLVADHPHRWAPLLCGAALACGALAAAPAWLRRRRRRELELTGVMTISGVLQRSPGDAPGSWPTSIGPVPVRFPRHWPALPAGETITVEASPFPELGRRRRADGGAGPVGRSFFVLSVRGGRELARELSSGELQPPRPGSRPLLSAGLALLAVAGFQGIASLDLSFAFFLSARYPLDVLRNDRGLPHQVASVAEAVAAQPRRGRSLAIASAWLNPEGCLVDVRPDEVAAVRAAEQRIEAALARALPAEADGAAEGTAVELSSVAAACSAARGELEGLFRSQCSRGMRTSGARGPSPAVCTGDADAVRGVVAAGLDALAVGMERPSAWSGIVTGTSDEGAPRPRIHVGWGHPPLWIAASVALHVGITLALLALVARVVVSIGGLARRRPVSAARW